MQSKGNGCDCQKAKALAFTALELFENPEELVKVKEDHAWHVEHQRRTNYYR